MPNHFWVDNKYFPLRVICFYEVKFSQKWIQYHISMWVKFFADVVWPDSNDHTSITIPPDFSVDIEFIWCEDLRAAYALAQPGFSANLDIWVERFNKITNFSLFILYTMQVAIKILGFNSFQEWFFFVWFELWRCSSWRRPWLKKMLKSVRC